MHLITAPNTLHDLEYQLLTFSQGIKIYSIALSEATIVIGFIITTTNIANGRGTVTISNCRSLDTINIQIFFAREKSHK
jgi:hypothetical protein